MSQSLYIHPSLIETTQKPKTLLVFICPNDLRCNQSVLRGESKGRGDAEDLRQHVAQLVEHFL